MSFGEIANIYELLQDEDESATIARLAKGKADAAKAKELAARKNESGIPASKAQKAAPAKASPAAPADSAPKKDVRRPRGEGKVEKGDRPPRSNNGERRPPREGGAPRTDRGDRPPREPREPREPRDGKRQFERRSGTGRGKEIKKGGAGKGNWGSEVDEKAPVEGEAPKEAVTTEEGAEKPAEEVKPVEKTQEEEEEDKTIAYDEYIKAKKAAVAELPAARQPGEGVDQSEWAEFVPLKRDDEETAAKKEKKASKKETEKEESAKKLRVDEVFKIQPAQKPERRERRDNRDNRDNRDKKPTGNKQTPRGGKQPRKSSGPAPNISDESSFPALS